MNCKRILVTGGSGFIGTNVIQTLVCRDGVEVLSLDLVKPKVRNHDGIWLNVDIRNGAELKDAISRFKPDAVIHLAARTDLNGASLDDYTSNTVGTATLLSALESVGFSGSAIFASSMYVCEPGYKPKSVDDYSPHTIYGRSKVEGELIIRAKNASYPWVIVRPTSIWGPWFGEPYFKFFEIVLSGKYMHIGNDRTTKTYGYVGNTVEQLLIILKNMDVLRGNSIYLGDWDPYVISEWADEISTAIDRKVPVVPKFVFRGLALIGDALSVLGLGFPMTSFRLRNMTTSNVHNLDPIKSLMKTLPYTRSEGSIETIRWMGSQKKA